MLQEPYPTDPSDVLRAAADLDGGGLDLFLLTLMEGGSDLVPPPPD